nr:hypothetical protein BaRGS_032251 [Batillaria attramentaria]
MVGKLLATMQKTGTGGMSYTEIWDVEEACKDADDDDFGFIAEFCANTQFLVEEKLWDIVKELADHSLYDDQRGWALGQALYDKQWDVMVVLADHGLTDEQLRKVYRQVAKHADWHTMMEADQWILVARVMELSLDDTERRRVMQAALEKKEGSVVAHGISVMEGRLSVEEREVMFDQALSQGVWQGVKRLVEEKDDTGMAQSDEALVAAVEQHRWDMVDHCDKHGADINKRDAEGDTLLHKNTRREDWDTVEGLLHHGADTNLPDSEGYSAFHNVVESAVRYSDDTATWDTVNTFVKFHGDISLPDPRGQTPLCKIIPDSGDYRRKSRVYRGDILDCALTWGGNVDWTENYKGKTALHVLCQAGLWDSMRYIVARGGDPLAVTDDGKTSLIVAVEYDMEIPDGYKRRYGYEEGERKWEAEDEDGDEEENWYYPDSDN